MSLTATKDTTMRKAIISVGDHQPVGAAWLDSLPDAIGQQASDLLTGEWALTWAVQRTSWRTVWDIFDQARADDRFTLTTEEWDDVEASLVAVGGVDSRDDLAAADEEDDDGE